ncbi:MAG: carbohydrate kinase family protein [Firmicutes bacterium]|nr:carbohydrate kinase family protein [Bacillota bacterium]
MNGGAAPEVVGLGSCTVDYFAMVPKILGPEEKVNCRDLHVYAGGVTANNLTQVARLGLWTGWFGKIGDDGNGKLLLQAFEEDGMDVSHVEVVPGRLSSSAWIPVDPGGGRCIYMFPNVTKEITAEEVESRHADYIRSARALHTEVSQLPIGPVLKAMEIARGAGVMVLLDLDVDPSYFTLVAGLGTLSELTKALRLTDVLAPCKAAAEELTGEKDPERMVLKLLSYGPRMVVVSDGARGCVLGTDGEAVRIPAYRVDVVDTTGAGDAFHGGLSFGLLKGWDLARTGRFANACGALCCMRVGARAMARLEEVWAFLGTAEPLP